MVSAICVADLLVALRFTAMANRADSEMADPSRAASAIDPQAMRRLARLLFLTVPVTWLFVAALSFGLIPADGITAIKF